MFWKFGFHNASSIDSLLDKDDVVLEAILDEDDLLQECKAQNTRLIDYFQRVDVLQRLFAYVTGQTEGEEKGRFKYPFVATEVLCSEIWSIVETCVNHSAQLLAPFWETVLDRSPDDMKTQMTMASHFSKINAVFLSKKPAEMFLFIQSQPSIVERILRHVENPSFVDLLLRIIQLDEQPGGSGVLEWLSSENLMGRLIDLLSSAHTSDVHAVVAETIKGIISMAAPSPGAGLAEGLQNGPASNRFARELARPASVLRLAGYMLTDFNAQGGPTTLQDAQNATAVTILNPDPSTPPTTPPLPSIQSATSSVVQSVGIIIELIRKNNSDYFEPYLFHTLRNRLIQVQQHLQHSQDGRETLERAMEEMVDRMGVVHLGSVLEVMCERLGAFQGYLRCPRSSEGPAPTTVGQVAPLTFERYRICELYAELLHCSNMSLLNRSPEYNHLYDSEGRLQGGLAALEELSKVISIGSGEERDHDTMDESNDDVEPALELPVSNPSHGSPSLIDSDESMSDDEEPGSSDDDAMEEIAMYDDHPSQNHWTASSLSQPPLIVPSSPNAASLPSPVEIAAHGAALAQHRSLSSDSDNSTAAPPSHNSHRSSRRTNTLDNPHDVPPIGEKLKRKFLDMGVLSTLLDLFFEFPWNNFLHSVVYDLIHQILTGRVDGGLNRELTVSLFRDARLMHRIVEGQKRNDIESVKPKGVRLGYMGHLTLISEDIIGALAHYPPDLRASILSLAPQPEWDEYVNGRYMETKRRDTSLLGGGKPVVAPGVLARGGASRWKVDEEDTPGTASLSHPENGNSSANGVKGEFRRASSVRPERRSTADFGPARMDDGEDEESAAPQFARYQAQEMHFSDQFSTSQSSDASDDEDEDGGWLAQSTFELRNPPVSGRGHHTRRLVDSDGFDDAFVPGDRSRTILSNNPFGASNDDDGSFGPFSDSAPASGTDPFTFETFSEDVEDSAFDSFGDFGDFQTAQDGELTPTAGSWTFESGSSTSGVSDEAGSNSVPWDETAKDKSRMASVQEGMIDPDRTV